MNRTYAFAMAAVLVACASMALVACETKTSTDAAGISTTVKVTTAKTQNDVKWGCLALRGGISVYTALSPLDPNLPAPTDPGIKTGFAVITNTCDHQDKLTNLEDAYQVVMDAAGQVAAALVKKQTGG